MKTRALVITIVLFGILALALAGGFVLIWRLFFLSLLLLLIGRLWTMAGVHGLDGQVKTSAERCQVGDWFSEETTVVNRSRLPKLMVKAETRANLPGHRNAAAFNLALRSSHSWQTAVACRRRGRYSVGTLTATVTDPFGLFTSRRELGEVQHILVYPATVELPFFQPTVGREPAYGRTRWSISEISPNASRVREYASGDRLNRLHWPTTAHAGKLMVKEFDPDRSHSAARNVLVILDMYQGCQVGEGERATEEYGVTIAASLIAKYNESDRPVGLMALGDQACLFPPQTGSQHLEQVMTALAMIKATGDVPIEQLISGEVEHFGDESAIIVITPSTSEGIANSLQEMRRRGATVVAILLDPPSFGGTLSAVNLASGLISRGLQTYIVRCGEDLTRALNSQVLIPHLRYIADRL